MDGSKAWKIPGNRGSVAGQLAEKLRQLSIAINTLNEKKGADGKSFDQRKKLGNSLRSCAAILAGKRSGGTFCQKPTSEKMSVLSNDRYATPGGANVLECKLLDSAITNLANFSFDEGMKFFSQISILFQKLKQTGNADEGDIWNPFMLEWEVEYLPAFPGSNEATPNREYEATYIRQHYKLDETKPDLSRTSKDDIFENVIFLEAAQY